MRKLKTLLLCPFPFLKDGTKSKWRSVFRSSQFGVVGMKGATSEKTVGLDVGNADEGLAELGGLRVF